MPAMSAGLAETGADRETKPADGTRQPPGDCMGQSGSGGSKTTMPSSETPPRRPKTVRGYPTGQDSLLLSV